jgi:hypothetical protein
VAEQHGDAHERQNICPQNQGSRGSGFSQISLNGFFPKTARSFTGFRQST